MKRNIPITSLILFLPISIFATDYSYIDSSTRIWVYQWEEKIMNPDISIPSKNWPTWDYYCKDWYAQIKEKWSSRGQWEPDHNTVLCLNKKLYDEQKAQKELEERNKIEAQSQTKTEKTTLKDIEELNKSIEDAKRIIETKKTIVTTTLSPEAKKLTPKNEKKAVVLRKKIQLLKKQLELLEKQLSSLS